MGAAHTQQIADEAPQPATLTQPIDEEIPQPATHHQGLAEEAPQPATNTQQVAEEVPQPSTEQSASVQDDHPTPASPLRKATLLAGLVAAVLAVVVIAGTARSSPLQTLRISQLRVELAAAQQQVQTAAKQMKSQEQSIKHLQDKVKELKFQLQSKESATQKNDAALRARLAAAQQQDASDVKAKDALLKSQEQRIKHLQDMVKEDDEPKKDAAPKESEASRQLIIFGCAGALVAILLVAAVAFYVAHKKHGALEQSQLQQVLLHFEEVPGKVGVDGKVGVEESKPSTTADLPRRGAAAAPPTPVLQKRNSLPKALPAVNGNPVQARSPILSARSPVLSGR